MIRYSPSNAIYQGFINFNDAHSEQGLANFASFDTFHQDLRFEFEDNVFVYSVLSRSFVAGATCYPKQISRFFFQKVNDSVVDLVYLSFLFQVGNFPGHLRTYYVEGYLKEGDRESVIFNRLNPN